MPPKIMTLMHGRRQEDVDPRRQRRCPPELCFQPDTKDPQPLFYRYPLAADDGYSYNYPTNPSNAFGVASDNVKTSSAGTGELAVEGVVNIHQFVAKSGKLSTRILPPE